jgi:hypothetical protein
MPQSRHRHPSYWIIKTTAGDTGKSYWDQFKANGVVAVGWPSVRLDPSLFMSLPALTRAIAPFVAGSSKKERQYSARILFAFTRVWQEGDIAIICDGYNTRGPRDVRLHGFAIVGPFHYRASSTWWRFQRDASIRCIDRDIPRRTFVSTLGLRTSRLTIHQISEGAFFAFSRQVSDLLPDSWKGAQLRTQVEFCE